MRNATISEKRRGKGKRPRKRPLLLATVTAVLDTQTGASSLYIRNDPRPWFAPSMRAELALDYGYKRDRDAPVFRAGARVDLLQIKALHFGLTGSVDSDSAWFVGAGIAVRW